MSIKNVISGRSFTERHIHKHRKGPPTFTQVRVKMTVWVDRPGKGYAERQRAKMLGLRKAA